MVERLKARVANHLPAAALGELRPSPLPGLYELSLPGQVAYVSSDGRYLVTGRIIDLETREDLTERVAEMREDLDEVEREDLRRHIIEGLDRADDELESLQEMLEAEVLLEGASRWLRTDPVRFRVKGRTPAGGRSATQRSISSRRLARMTL